MALHDLGSIYYDINNDRVFYFLISGKTYREIAKEYYCYDLNKFIYAVRKLRERLGLRNRRQLAYFAVVNKLVDLERILDECIENVVY